MLNLDPKGCCSGSLRGPGKGRGLGTRAGVPLRGGGGSQCETKISHTCFAPNSAWWGTQLCRNWRRRPRSRVCALGTCCPHFSALLNLTSRGAVAADTALSQGVGSRRCGGEFFQENGEAGMAQSVLGTAAWFREEENRKVFPKERVVSWSEVAQSCPTLRPHGRRPTRLLHPWDLPGKSTGVGLSSPSPGDLPDPGIEPILKADALPSEPPGKFREVVS